MAKKTSFLFDCYLWVLTILKRYPGLPNLASLSISFLFFFQFDVALTNTSGRPPKIYKVKMSKVAEINPEYFSIIIILAVANFAGQSSKALHSRRAIA